MVFIKSNMPDSFSFFSHNVFYHMSFVVYPFPNKTYGVPVTGTRIGTLIGCETVIRDFLDKSA